MNFQSYFSGAFGQSANVEMSTDGGSTWNLIYSCFPSIAWSMQEVVLTSYSGPIGLSSVKLAFHTNDNGEIASGWAVDDIVLYSGGLAVESYILMLDSVVIDTVPPDVLDYQFDLTTIQFGQEYTACVSATYCGVSSENECFTFIGGYMPPPGNFIVYNSVSSTSGAAILDWEAPANNSTSLAGYIFYRNDSVVYFSYDTISEYRDLNLLPGHYCYDVTAIYDLTPGGGGLVSLQNPIEQAPNAWILSMGLSFRLSTTSPAGSLIPRCGSLD